MTALPYAILLILRGTVAAAWRWVLLAIFAKTVGKAWKKEVKVKNGLAMEDAKKIVKIIKDAGLKVQASINDDLVRVTGKKIDDLQDVIQLCKNSNTGIPLQYVNMRD